MAITFLCQQPFHGQKGHGIKPINLAERECNQVSGPTAGTLHMRPSIRGKGQAFKKWRCMCSTQVQKSDQSWGHSAHQEICADEEAQGPKRSRTQAHCGRTLQTPLQLPSFCRTKRPAGRHEGVAREDKGSIYIFTYIYR